MDDVIADKDLLDEIQACQTQIAKAETRIRGYRRQIASKQAIRAGWEKAVHEKEQEVAAHLKGVDAKTAAKSHTVNASWRKRLTKETVNWINAEKIPYYQPAKGGFQRNVFKEDAFGNAFLLLLDEDEKDENLKLVEALYDIFPNLDVDKNTFAEQCTQDRMQCIKELETRFPYLQLCTAHGSHAFHMAVGLLSEFYEVHQEHWGDFPCDPDEWTDSLEEE